eukprot:TRINITY_DN12901_c0_g5_i1.p1 TRINITY_DN12901_c0_g5~~TRINITY_DN12901_c0_g5_i1.p1  ORF type:complete len:233 (-),score=37.59 TRINITY_DN12901_c0_g5_i1:58-690(-)
MDKTQETYTEINELILPSIVIRKKKHRSPISVDMHQLFNKKKERIWFERTPCVHAQNFSNFIMESPVSRNHFMRGKDKTAPAQIRNTPSRKRGRNGENLTQTISSKKRPITLRLNKPKELRTRGNYFALVKEQLNKILDKFSFYKPHAADEQNLAKSCTKEVSAESLYKDPFNRHAHKLTLLNRSSEKASLIKIIKKKYFPVFIPSPTNA